MNPKYFIRISIACIIIFLFVSSRNIYAFIYKGLDLKINGVITEIYDDNINFTKENRKEDFITKMIMNVNILYEKKHQILSLSGNLEQEVFAKREQFSNLDGGFSINLQREFSPYDMVGLSNTYTYSFEPGSFEDQFGKMESKQKTAYNKLNLSYFRDFGEYLNISTAYSYEVNSLGDEGVLFLGETAGSSYQNSLNLTAYFPHGADTSHLLSYSFAARKYKTTKDTVIKHTLTTGVRSYITKQLYIDGTIGADFIIKDTESKTVKGLGGYGRALLTDEFKNTNVRFSIEKRKDANVFTEELFDAWKTTASVTSQLSKRLSCSLSGFYGEGLYESLNIIEKLFGANIGFSYGFSENFWGELNYVHSLRVFSNYEQNPGYSRNTVEAGLHITF